MANDRWDLADIKSENVMVDYTTMSDGNVDIERVHLIDIENALPVKDEHFMYNIDIGHRFWRSPEAHARRMIGKPTDIFSFGLIVSLACEICLYCLLIIVPRLSTSCWEGNILSWIRVP